jgi:PKD repeat protein
MKTIKVIICQLILLCSVHMVSAQLASCNYNPVISSSTSGATITFVGTGTGVPAGASYYWNFGDGNFGFGANSMHTYNTNGVYNVCLTLFDSANFCIDTVCTAVTILGITACNASFSTSFVSNTLLQFTNTSSTSAGFTSFWDFGDGNTSNATNPTHTYLNSGVYTVCLVITSGGCVDSICMPVTAFGSGTPCNANFAASTSLSTTAIFFNTSVSTAPAATNYFWTFGDGNTSNNINPIHTYSAPGTYTVCLTMYDTLYNCADSFCNIVTVTGASGCNAGFTAINTAPNAITFTNTSNVAGALQTTWDFGDGSTQVTYGSAIAPTHVYTTPGNYLVCITILDTVLFCTDSFCATVSVVPVPSPCNANFSYTLNNLTSTSTFTNLSTSANVSNTSYYWSFGDGNNSNSFNPVHTYSSSGTYYVCLVVHDTLSNCVDSFCTFINIGSAPLPCNANFASTVLVGNNVSFVNLSTPIGNNFTSYWSFGDGNNAFGTNQSHTYASPGTYTVCLLIWDSLNLCSDSFCSIVAVGGVMPCNASFSTTFINNTILQFTNSSSASGVFTSYWSFGDGSTSTLANPTHTYANSGVYTVCLVITGGGCVDSFCTSVTAFGSGAPCSANFNTSLTGNTALFNNSSTGTSLNYLWWFGDGFTHNGQAPVHTYASPGIYNVCLFVSDSSNTCTDTMCSLVTIPVSASCNAQFTVAVSACSATLTNTSTGSYTNGIWLTNNTIITPLNLSTNSHTISYNANGVYPACLIVFDSLSNCVDTFCTPVVIFGCATGIENIFQTSEINIFPNPCSTNASIAISLNAPQLISIEILDLMGRILYKQSTNLQFGKNTVLLPLANFENGQYIVKIKDEFYNEKVLKLIKN